MSSQKKQGSRVGNFQVKDWQVGTTGTGTELIAKRQILLRQYRKHVFKQNAV
jgi:hypothetical protein